MGQSTRTAAEHAGKGPMSEEIKPEIAPVTTPTTAPVAVAAAPEEAGQPIVFHSQDALNERLQRAERSALRTKFAELGVADDADLVARLKRATELEEQEEKRRLESMSELDRERTARVVAETRASEMEEAAKRSAFQAHLTRICAEKGVRDLELAEMMVEREARRLKPSDAPLDEAAYIDLLLLEPKYRMALGVDAVQSPGAPTQTPVTTSPVSGAGFGSQPTPAAVTPPASASDANTLSPEAWAARKRALGMPV